MLIHTIRQQLKGMFFLYFFAISILLLISSFSTFFDSNRDIMPIYFLIVGLIWPIVSASLLFNKEFQNGSLTYLFGAPRSRKQILTYKVLPSLILGIIPAIVTMMIIPILSPDQNHPSTLTYLSFYLTLQATATIFSFLPSMLTIFTLSFISGVVLWGFIPFSCSLVSSWNGGFTQFRHYLYGLLISSGPISSFWEAFITFWLLYTLPMLLLIGWFWEFTKHAEPDYHRTYHKMIPKGSLILTGVAILIFVLIYIFLPVEPWGDYHLTREGHLFFHGDKISKLKTDTDNFSLHNDPNSEFLAETDDELILTLPGEKDQIDLIGWNKTDGRTRQICSLPVKPSLKMIFQPPYSILCLAKSNPGEWAEIDLASGRKTNHPFMPFDQEGDGKHCFPIAVVSSGNTRMILISNSDLKYFRIDYARPLSVYLCQADQTPQFLGESQGLPIQLSKNEIVFIMRSRQAMEKYRLNEDQLSLVESAPLPKMEYWHIVRDFRFWPAEQPLFGLFGQYKERILLTVRLSPLETNITPLKHSEIRYFGVSTTPNWSSMMRHDVDNKKYLIQRLDRPQALLKYPDNQIMIYPNPHAFGFLTTEGWPPKWYRIYYPEGKIERMPHW